MAGAQVKASRLRRQMMQKTLAGRVGISQARLSEIEAGRGAGTPAEVWFALAEALGRYLRFEFAKDPQAELADAGHLSIQELVIRVTKPCGWEASFEARSRPESGRSVDVRLVDRPRRRLAIVECWNTFGDLGRATRSSDQKLVEAEAQAVAVASDGEPFAVGLCWVVRDTRANRELVARYEHIFEARLPGSSVGWVRALSEPGAPMPNQPGLVWCDVRTTRLFAHRRGKGDGTSVAG